MDWQMLALCTSNPSYLCSGLFWHLVQMREHLWTEPEPHKILLLGYCQGLVPTFPKITVDSPNQILTKCGLDTINC